MARRIEALDTTSAGAPALADGGISYVDVALTCRFGGPRRRAPGDAIIPGVGVFGYGWPNVLT